MTSPKLSLHASGYGGRGYADIFNVNDGNPLMSITTALGVLDKPGVRRWERQQIAAYAVTHIDDLLSRPEEVGYRYLMAVPKFISEKNHDELDTVDVWNAAEVALNDAADAGTWIHEYIEADLGDGFPAEPVREDHYQMVEAYHEWKYWNDVEVLSVERTVYGNGYAGTADLFAVVNGVTTLIDIKTSRSVYDTHISQLGAIGAAITTAQEVPEGTAGAVKHKLQPKVSEEWGGQEFAWYVEEPLPAFQEYGILQIRPLDYDTTGEVVEPFAKLHKISSAAVNAGYELFTASRDARLAQKKMKDILKEDNV